MKLSNFLSPLLVLIIAIPLFFVHNYILEVLKTPKELSFFSFSTLQLYCFFSSCSVIIITILLFVKKKNLDIVGNFFLLLTMIKMGFAYVLLHTIGQNTHALLSFEKKNFFITFILFLAIETLITIRLLNKK